MMITKEIVNRAIDYILKNADRELTVDEVARHCHFSKYYFSRVFKAETGESIYGFIKRVRMDQSAFRLKTEQERSITEICGDYGYSSSNYSTTFRQHYRTTPVDFRRKIYTDSVKHPFFHKTHSRIDTFEECDEKITVEELKDYYVIYERRFGNYRCLSRNWNEFIERYQEYITEHTLFLERTFDDPSITDTDHCLYDVCMSVEQDCDLENTCVISGGKCAVYHFKGLAKHIYGAYQSIFNIWLPKSRYEIDQRQNFDIYRVIDCDTMYMELDICIPIR